MVKFFRNKSPYIHELLLSLQLCPGGEIGRRTVFRSQRGKPCAGSNPVLGTNKKSPARSAGLFYINI
ncbi:MAG: hypothetical protein RLZZ333_937 [Bacteroidota bacterium]